jgi:hypothetical protein
MLGSMLWDSVVVCLKCYLCNYLEGLRETMNNLSLNNWCPDDSSKQSPPQCQKYYQLSQLAQSVECWVS